MTNSTKFYPLIPAGDLPTAEAAMDCVLDVLGDRGPRKMRLIAEYTGHDGAHLREPMLAFPWKNTPDEVVAAQVGAGLAARGYQLAALWEVVEDGNALRPICMDLEYAQGCLQKLNTLRV